MLPEDEKTLGVPSGDNLSSPVEIGLTDLPNISGPPGTSGSGITDLDCRDVNSLSHFTIFQLAGRLQVTNKIINKSTERLKIITQPF